MLRYLDIWVLVTGHSVKIQLRFQISNNFFQILGKYSAVKYIKMKENRKKQSSKFCVAAIDVVNHLVDFDPSGMLSKL